MEQIADTLPFGFVAERPTDVPLEGDRGFGFVESEAEILMRPIKIPAFTKQLEEISKNLIVALSSAQETKGAYVLSEVEVHIAFDKDNHAVILSRNSNAGSMSLRFKRAER